MADVIILYPKTTFSTKDFSPILPLAPLYISIFLEEKGFEVKILDERMHPSWLEDIRSEIQSQRPLCVAISSMTGPQIAGGLKASQLVKAVDKQIPVVWGGVHPSLLPEQTLRSEYIDIVVVGEGEYCFPEVVEALRENKPLRDIPGICYKENGQPHATHPREFLDLNVLPDLPYHLLDVNKYMQMPFLVDQQSLPIITSRGCPYHCEYCYSLAYNRRKWRALSAERVFEVIEHLTHRYEINSLYLLDDEFFIDRKRVSRLCDLILRKGLSLAFHNANIRVNEVLDYDLETLRMLRRTGFVKVFLGVESGSDEILERIHKGIKAEQVLEANRRLKTAGIVPIFSFMGGFPFETSQDVHKTLSLSLKLLNDNPDALFYGISLYSPFPGTPLFDYCVQKGMPVPEDLEGWVRFEYDRLNYRQFSNKDLAFIKDAALFSQYTHPRLMLLADDGALIRLLKKFYSALIRLRIKKNIYACRLEVKLHRILKLSKQKVHNLSTSQKVKANALDRKALGSS